MTVAPTAGAALFSFLLFAGSAAVLVRLQGRSYLRWALTASVAALIAARAGYLLQSPAALDSPAAALRLWDGVSVLWGGAALLLVSFIFFRESPRRLLWALLPVLLAGSGWALSRHWEAPAQLPELTLRTLDGAQRSLAAPLGRPRVVNLWASWCGPCRREMPLLLQAARAHPDIRFEFVNQGETPTAAARYAAAVGLDNAAVLLDPEQTLLRYYALPGLPATLFFDARGRLLTSVVGELSAQRLQAALAHLRRELPGVEQEG